MTIKPVNFLFLCISGWSINLDNWHIKGLSIGGKWYYLVTDCVLFKCIFAIPFLSRKAPFILGFHLLNSKQYNILTESIQSSSISIHLSLRYQCIIDLFHLSVCWVFPCSCFLQSSTCSHCNSAIKLQIFFLHGNITNYAVPILIIWFSL